MNIKAIGTHIKVSNFAKSKQFYQNMGFKTVFAYGPNQPVKEIYHGLVFEHGGCKLEIANGHRAVKPSVFKQTVASSKISLMIYVKDLKPIISRAKKANIKLAVSPRHYYWGTLELVITDPDGVVLVFIAPYSKSAAKNLNADETWGKPPKSS